MFRGIVVAAVVLHQCAAVRTADEDGESISAEGEDEWSRYRRNFYGDDLCVQANLFHYGKIALLGGVGGSGFESGTCDQAGFLCPVTEAASGGGMMANIAGMGLSRFTHGWRGSEGVICSTDDDSDRAAGPSVKRAQAAEARRYDADVACCCEEGSSADCKYVFHEAEPEGEGARCCKFRAGGCPKLSDDSFMTKVMDSPHQLCAKPAEPDTDPCHEKHDSHGCTHAESNGVKCNWCRQAKYKVHGFGDVLKHPVASFGGATDEIEDGTCMSLDDFQVSEENMKEQRLGGTVSKYTSDVDLCWYPGENVPANVEPSATNGPPPYDIDVCHDMGVEKRPYAWHAESGEGDPFGIKCYGSKEELVADKEWCTTQYDHVPPASVQGFYWMHGVNAREIGFCGSVGRWDDATNTLHIETVKSWVYEDSPAGLRNAEEMRKSQFGVTVKYTFSDETKEHVKTADIKAVWGGNVDAKSEILQGVINANFSVAGHQFGTYWGIREVEEKDYEGIPTENVACVVGTPDCYLRYSEGIAAFAPYYFRRLYTGDGSETEHVKAFMGEFTQHAAKGYDWTANPLKTKYMRYSFDKPYESAGDHPLS